MADSIEGGTRRRVAPERVSIRFRPCLGRLEVRVAERPVTDTKNTIRTAGRTVLGRCRRQFGHLHSVQSLGRGISDDAELLDWLFDYILPMEATLTADEMEIAAKLGYLELIESGTTTAIDHLSVDHADRAFEAAGELGIRGVLGKVLIGYLLLKINIAVDT